MIVLRINENFDMNGGIARYIQEILPGLNNAGCINILLSGKEDDILPAGSQAIFYEPSVANWSLFDSRESLKRLEKLLTQVKPDLVHFHNCQNPLLIQYCSAKLPTVVSMHGYHAFCPGGSLYHAATDEICELRFGPMCLVNTYTKRCNNRHPVRLLRSMARCAVEQRLRSRPKLFLVRTEQFKKRMLQLGYQESKVVVLPHCVNTKKFGSDSPLFEDLILFVGRLGKPKGVQYLLEAMRFIRHPCQLVIAGDGNWRSHLENLARSLELKHRVEFAGWVDDKRLVDLYRRATAVVIPSVWPEVFGAVGLEAMASRVPVVAFDVGGISSWLKDGLNGFLVERKNIDALACRIEQLLENKGRAARMGQHGREMVETRYTVEHHVSQLLQIYNRVLNGAYIN